MSMWYSIYTKPCNEDLVTCRLQRIGIEVLNPKLKSKKYKQNKLLEVIEPLFPCYIFANFEKDRYAHLITYTRGVRYIVGKTNPAAVHDEIIVSIRNNMENDNIVVIRPPRFEKGDRVLIKEGPFKDFYGIFEREIRGPERVMILLNAIQCRLDLDSCFLYRV